MMLHNMEQVQMPLGPFARPDNERFEINAVLYLTPPNYDYRLVAFDVAHEEWGHMRFQAIIPKKGAETHVAAQALIKGPIYAQVKAALLGATSSGRDLAPVFSVDGWTLV